MEPTPAPSSPTSIPPAPVPPTPSVTPPAWSTPPTPQQLPDEHATRKRVTLIILIALTLVAIGLAAMVFVPWNQSTGGAPIQNSVSLDQINAATSEADGLMQEVDANMAGVDPSLNDVQGDLSE